MIFEIIAGLALAGFFVLWREISNQRGAYCNSILQLYRYGNEDGKFPELLLKLAKIKDIPDSHMYKDLGTNDKQKIQDMLEKIEDKCSLSITFLFDQSLAYVRTYEAKYFARLESNTSNLAVINLGELGDGYQLNFYIDRRRLHDIFDYVLTGYLMPYKEYDFHNNPTHEIQFEFPEIFLKLNSYYQFGGSKKNLNKRVEEYKEKFSITDESWESDVYQGKLGDWQMNTSTQYKQKGIYDGFIFKIL